MQPEIEFLSWKSEFLCGRMGVRHGLRRRGWGIAETFSRLGKFLLCERAGEMKDCPYQREVFPRTAVSLSLTVRISGTVS